MKYKFIFDLDNTLINTDLLNNKSYNYALDCFNLPTINTNERITRDLVFLKLPWLSEVQKKEIVMHKQQYFLDHIYLTSPNITLIQLLKSKNKADCILWTSADPKRVRALLSQYGITNCFFEIIYSKKTCIKDDVDNLCSMCNCSNKSLVFYEDNLAVIEELKKLCCKVSK